MQNQKMNKEELEQSYLAQLESTISSGPYQKLKKAALEKFRQLGIPTNKWEDWKYTHMPSFLPAHLNFQATDVETGSTPVELSDVDFFQSPYTLFFHNGLLRQDLSQLPEGLELSIESQQDSLEQNKIKELDEIKDPFLALSRALLNQYVTLSIPASTSLSSPINIIHYFDPSLEQKPAVTELNIKVSPFSKACFIEHFYDKTETNPALLSLQRTSINAQESSCVDHIKVSTLPAQSTHLGTLSCAIDKSAALHSFTFTLGGGLNRHNLDINLNAQQAHARVDGLFTTKGEEHVDNFSAISHKKSHTTSAQLFKGILDDSSRGVFTGKVVIDRHAQKVDAEQLNKNLLLTKKAKINTRPQLEVYADDVKCAHGATIGQISEEELFYLESRGIAREKAYQMLCHAFVSDVIMRIENPAIEKWLEELLYRKFKKLENMSLINNERGSSEHS